MKITAKIALPQGKHGSSNNTYWRAPNRATLRILGKSEPEESTVSLAHESQGQAFSWCQTKAWEGDRQVEKLFYRRRTLQCNRPHSIRVENQYLACFFPPSSDEVLRKLVGGELEEWSGCSPRI